MTCGIYSITNTVNGKRYYGSSVNMEGRRRQHWSDLRNGKHKNPHLQAAWNLYGDEFFVFSPVEEVCAEKLQAVEQSYLDANADGYNVAKCAECATRGMKWSNESKKRFSDRMRGRKLSDAHKALLSVRGRGKVATQATRAKLRAANLGKKHSSQTKDKIAATVSSKWKDPKYRNWMISMQQTGKDTAEAKANYSAAVALRWSTNQQREAMSAERKVRWTNPEYRAKMIAKRKIQGQKLRERNLNEKETQNARA